MTEKEKRSPKSHSKTKMEPDQQLQPAKELEIIADYVKSTRKASEDEVKGHITQKLLKLMKNMNMSNNLNALQQLEKNLTATESLFTSLNRYQPILKSLQETRSSPANKNISVQRKFYSTTKKRKHKTNVRYGKPTQDEKTTQWLLHVKLTKVLCHVTVHLDKTILIKIYFWHYLDWGICNFSSFMNEERNV